ncbi:AMP-dependent synthetase/ligase [Sulfobacillus harzensis]|uniref:Long-chain fatty acid--CoA ligase n=1 Tax=Sulfobacillus harzensis TaxID=2729629 RepID=A0A7Y0L4B4_9FIRM|nr:long-chain fatty acid--CoA ligase [Sulfobacillus harzensis]NMP23061.1 long-chain fatty acid--CoA ligase [Sulfobacillus harzensis]
MSFENLPSLLLDSAHRFGDQPAQRFKMNGQWRDRTYQELWNEVVAVAHGLKTLGIQEGDRVALLSRTRPEWVIADYATLSLGAVTVPIYPSLPKDQVAFILEDSGAKAAFVEDGGQAVKIPDNLLTVAIDGHPRGCRSWLWLKETGLMHADDAFPRPIGRDHLASLVYTSGTTGRPKGVMLTHGNILANVEGFQALVDEYPDMQVGPKDVALSFLPLSHILERMAHAFQLSRGITIAYAESVDTLATDLVETAPSIMVAVPRVFEKVYAKVQDQVASESAFKQRAFQWAVAGGRRRYQLSSEGRPIPSGLIRQQRMADRLVFSKVREALGGQLRYVISGGAPLAREIGEFFYAMGVTILEGYGLTETSPVLTVNPPDSPRYGSVGRPLSNVEIAIAEDGEILARGPNVMSGYWNLPEGTEEALQDGWFHTGDIGELTPEGRLVITDRKKALLVLSTGKNVAPGLVETHLILAPYIEQAVVVGDRQKFVGALLYLNPDKVMEWAQQHQIPMAAYDDLLSHPDLYRFIMGEVERVTAPLAAFERPKRIRFLPHELTEASGELTPSLKIKVPVVLSRYRQLVEDLYAQEMPTHAPTLGTMDPEPPPAAPAPSKIAKPPPVIVDLLGSVVLGALFGLLLRVIL